jgi:hypothetical protein
MRFFQQTKMWYNIFRGASSGYLGGTRHDVHIPVLFSQIMSDVVNKTEAIFADNDVIQFIPNSDTESAIAKKNTALVNAQLIESDSYLKAVDFFMSASVYGTGIARTSWKLERKTKLYRVNVMGQEQILPSMKTNFDGPNWEVVDILDFIPEPGKNRLDQCNWVIHTYYVDLDDLLEMQSGEGSPTFSPEAIIELLDSPMGADARDAWKMRTNTYRTWTDYSERAGQQFSKPVRIDEYWGKVPSEFGINGDRNLVITIANERVVLRYEPNPFWDDTLPFIIYTPMPDMHSLHGTGKAEISSKTQASINKLANIKLDALEIYANPAHWVSDTAGLEAGNHVIRPGKLIPVRGEDINKVVMPISPDLRALQMTYQEIMQLSGFQQQGIGIPNDVVQGLSSGGRETARSAMMRRDGAMSRLAGESTLAEYQMIIPLGQRYKYYDDQLLPLPKQVKIIGQDAVMDPETGMPLVGQPATIGYGDLSVDHRCRAHGASRIMGKGMMAQQLMTYGQLATTNPIMMAMMNWVSFNKAICRALNLNPTELLVQQVQVPMVNQLALQMGQDPTAMLTGMAQGQGMGQLTGTEPGDEVEIANMGGGSDSL